MRSHRSVLLVLAVAACASIGIASASALSKGPTATAAQTQCTATFHVLHDDVIGDLQLPTGQYQLQTFQLTCAKASLLFTEFLEDYNGVLPKPWRYTVQGVGQGTFQRGTGQARFQATRTGDIKPNTSGHISEGGGSHGDLSCGFFTVEHNDRIGALRLPQGDYLVTTLGPRLTCSTATSLFRQFLRRPSGRLPGGWVVLPQTGEFIKGTSHYGFRVKSLDQD
jgi:hypothetical protein